MTVAVFDHTTYEHGPSFRVFRELRGVVAAISRSSMVIKLLIGVTKGGAYRNFTYIFSCYFPVEANLPICGEGP
jgi:hypothetical protein